MEHASPTETNTPAMLHLPRLPVGLSQVVAHEDNHHPCVPWASKTPTKGQQRTKRRLNYVAKRRREHVLGRRAPAMAIEAHNERALTVYWHQDHTVFRRKELRSRAGGSTLTVTPLQPQGLNNR